MQPIEESVPGNLSLTVTIQIDEQQSARQQIAWLLSDFITGEELIVSDFGSLAGQTRVEVTVDNLHTGSFQFLLQNSEGNGIQNGFITITNQTGGVVWDNNGKFRSSKQVILVIDDTGNLIAWKEQFDAVGLWAAIVSTVSSWFHR